MTPYQESYGDDRTVIPDYMDTGIDRYEQVSLMWYDWVVHMWKCRCDAYKINGVCKHAYRYRHQVTVKVKGEYL